MKSVIFLQTLFLSVKIILFFINHENRNVDVDYV